ncbi:MAG: ATP synthase F0 subunit C [Abditibacteriales bacterium]|nr:ATP synthase F0 subunit C [Abditibacteriales bacterium]MDW8364773.1 ATP synthase F0 subunit C [Abditibacteriales bacterium]
MAYLAVLALVIGFGLPLAVLSAAYAQGRVASSALEGMARQPEAAGNLQTGMIIALAFIESLIIYALLMFFMLQGKMPTIEQVMEMVKAGAK